MDATEPEGPTEVDLEYLSELDRGPAVRIRRKAWYSTGTVATLLGLDRVTVRGLLERGDIPSYRLPDSRERRVDHRLLLAWLKAQPGMEYAYEELRDAT